MGEPTDADTAARNQYMGDTLPKMAIAEFLGGKSKTRKSRKTRKSKSRRFRK
jgi:hypothetical protein